MGDEEPGRVLWAIMESENGGAEGPTLVVVDNFPLVLVTTRAANVPYLTELARRAALSAPEKTYRLVKFTEREDVETF